VLISKVCLLGRNLDDFITLIRAVAALVEQHWADVHPRPEGDDLQPRQVSIESIDAQPTVIMPLQTIPLITHRRLGAISFRAHQLASGALTPREGEETVDPATIDKIVREAELSEMVARRDEIVGLRDALQAILRTWSAHADGPPVDLGKIVELVGRMVAFLDSAITTRDPSAGLPAADEAAGEDAADGGEAAARVAVGKITSAAEAAAALTGVADYFAHHEPSSPTLLLVRQASQLLGKSFLEVMRVLVPNHVETAAIEIGRIESFSLPIERLSAFGEGNGAAAAEPNGDGTTPAFNVGSRAEALALLDQVAAYLRVAEPTSPVPFLIDRARDLAQRDFLSVLKALLPADALKPNSS
jgi:type VI secretion system protein ImpA